MNRCDRVCVIGGGFYGAVISLFLKEVKKISDICIVEQEDRLLSRASYVNQARVHNGYHYPRSFTTAFRSRVNYGRFCDDWIDSIKSDFSKYYAIARRNSKVTSSQFQRFCQQIDAPLEPAETAIKELFNPALIENVFKVQEAAFNANSLRAWAERQLAEHDVVALLRHKVLNVRRGDNGGISVRIRSNRGGIKEKDYSMVFNCTYSGLGQLHAENPPSGFQLKHEIAELAMVEVPGPLTDIGITVMDGPFFSVMPFPAQACHSFSHVRYTPHCHWIDNGGESPYEILSQYQRESRLDRMMRDGARYLPILSECRPRQSLFEVKTVLEKNEANDGRPILFREDTELPGLYSVLGSKIDNIYDILDSISVLPELNHA
jgi:glycine/D-amino acid oxidase-like deaminating enzyme